MESIREAYHRYLRYFLSKDDSTATMRDRYMALAYAVRSEMVDRWIRTQEYYHQSGNRRVYYLCPEYSLGKSLHQNILSLGLLQDVADTASELGFSLDAVFECEDDLELGNGPRGRHAAAIMESMASLRLPGMGYGIRYDYGLFRQRIVDGAQVEVPYDWQNREHPWEISRPEYQQLVQFGGRAIADGAPDYSAPHRWVESHNVLAMPTDIPVPGFGCNTVNTLRLWSSRPAEQFPTEYTHHGDYVKACEDMTEAGRITRVLHPDSDIRRATPQRLRLQYFLVATSLHDIVRRYKSDHGTVDGMERKVVIHLSGSSCALAIPEFLRIMVDMEGVLWDEAWRMARSIFSATTHALGYDHVEIWPVYMIEQILPRHLQIIYALNQRHLDVFKAANGANDEMIRQVSLIEEGDVKRVRMGHLMVLACRNVVVVAGAQRAILGDALLPRLLESAQSTLRVIPNGVSHRRWLLGRSPRLSLLVTEAIGDGWIRDASQLRKLEPLARDASLAARFQQAKQAAKNELAALLKRDHDITLNTDALLDVQIKRIHPVKRQLLHLLCIVSRFLRCVNGDNTLLPRVHLFSGKAMPTDFLAKQTIELIHVAMRAIAADPRVRDCMQIVFVPDYRLSVADSIVPAAQLAEEISAPSFEACNTTQAKMLMGGANVVARRGGVSEECIEAIGERNLFLFGDVTVAAGAAQRQDTSPGLKDGLHAACIWLEEHAAAQGVERVFPLLSSLRERDRHFVCADMDEYCALQDRVDAAFRDSAGWAGMALTALARAGACSADLSLRRYAADIWQVEPAVL